MPYQDDITFTVTCTMRSRWAAQFLGMLQHMEKLGSWGSSRDITFMADGDGDFRPKFVFSGQVPDQPIAEGTERPPGSGDMYFDAG